MDALEAIAAVFNALELHYCDSSVMYEIGRMGMRRHFFMSCETGQAEADRHERIRSGTFTVRDLKGQPPL